LRSTCLDERQTIDAIWKILRPDGQGGDPFSDDVCWLENGNKKLIVFKSDMLVSSTDAPSSMSPEQIGAKAIVSCVSDFAAKGVKPLACSLSIALPRARSNKEFVSRLARGFRIAEKKYGVRIAGGDTGESESEIVIDCSMFGLANRIVERRGARLGDLLGTTGKFGLESSGLSLLLSKGRRKASSKAFKSRAIKSVLEPDARLDLGLRIRRYTSSSIDSSDGLALSLYYLAEASGVDLKVDHIPIATGVEEFALQNSLSPEDLALFGGEEYELVFTFDPKYERVMKKLGVIVIGRVLGKAYGKHSLVYLSSRVLPRVGYVHNQVARNR
jgi:thiamine-monophosphate kinase